MVLFLQMPYVVRTFLVKPDLKLFFIPRLYRDNVFSACAVLRSWQSYHTKSKKEKKAVQMCCAALVAIIPYKNAQMCCSALVTIIPCESYADSVYFFVGVL